jgi:L-aminopeptidase/D-esterase-like protein
VAVGALAVVNAFGDVRDAAGTILAGARGPQGFADVARHVADGVAAPERFGDVALQNTTLAFVATNVALDRQVLAQLARAATGALYRRITPVGTTFDGDTVFAACPLDGGPPAPAVQLEALGVRALEEAVERAVRLAVGRDGVPGLADAR